MSQNVYIGMTLKPWPILLDHYSDELIISEYPGVKRRWEVEQIRELSEAENFSVFVKKTDEFLEITASGRQRSTEDIKNTYRSCKNAHEWSCHSILNGVYYKCSRAYHLTKNVECESKPVDGLEISDKPDFPKKLIEYINREEPLISCKNCLGTSGSLKPHTQKKSKQRKEEIMTRKIN